MVLGDAVFVWILNRVSRSITWPVYVNPKSTKRSQLASLDVIVHLVVSVLERSVKI